MPPHLITTFHQTPSLLYHPLGTLHFHTNHANKLRWVLTLALLALFPSTFLREPCDAHLITTLFKFAAPFRTLPNLQLFCIALKATLPHMMRKSTLFALLVVLLKLLVSSKGLTHADEHVITNVPVIYRAVIEPDETDCLPLSPKTVRKILFWEIKNGLKLIKQNNFTITTIYPTLLTQDLNQGKTLGAPLMTVLGYVEIDNRKDGSPEESYPHPVSQIRRYCAEIGENCEFIQSAKTFNGVTTIMIHANTTKRVRITMGGKHRPGLTSIRETALAALRGADEGTCTRVALGVEAALRFASCFKKDTKVGSVKVPFLIVDVPVVAVLVFVEAVIRWGMYRAARRGCKDEMRQEYLKRCIEESGMLLLG